VQVVRGAGVAAQQPVAAEEDQVTGSRRRLLERLRNRVGVGQSLLRTLQPADQVVDLGRGEAREVELGAGGLQLLQQLGQLLDVELARDAVQRQVELALLRLVQVDVDDGERLDALGLGGLHPLVAPDDAPGAAVDHDRLDHAKRRHRPAERHQVVVGDRAGIVLRRHPAQLRCRNVGDLDH